MSGDRFPYEPKPTRVPNAALINVEGNQLVYAKQLSGRDQAVVLFEATARALPTPR